MFDIITFGSATRDIIVTPKKVTGLQYAKNTTTPEICFPLGSKIDVDEIHFMRKDTQSLMNGNETHPHVPPIPLSSHEVIVAVIRGIRWKMRR